MKYFIKVDTHIAESLQYIQEDVDGNWTLVFEDGDMKVPLGEVGCCKMGVVGVGPKFQLQTSSHGVYTLDNLDF